MKPDPSHKISDRPYDPGPPVPAAASGCYLAMQRLDWNMSRIAAFLMFQSAGSKHEKIEHMGKIFPVMKELNPAIFAGNMLIPYLVSAVEQYFKDTYMALVKYSQKKDSLFRGVRLSGEQMSAVSSGSIAIEDAIVENMSFQNLKATGRYFRELDAKIDIEGQLRKPYRRRKKSLHDTLEELVEARHDLIHRMHMDHTLDLNRIQLVRKDIGEAMKRIYVHVRTVHGWNIELPISTNF